MAVDMTEVCSIRTNPVSIKYHMVLGRNYQTFKGWGKCSACQKDIFRPVTNQRWKSQRYVLVEWP